MKQTEKNSSKANIDVLSPKVIKMQLQSACANMDAAQTKEYIKGLDGYSIKQTGANKDRTHATIFYGDMRICNVENVQGITKDGTARGCVSVAKVNFIDKANSIFAACIEKLQLTDSEKREAEAAFEAAFDNLQAVQGVFDAANERAKAEAEAAAKEKRAAAAKEKAQRKMNNKLKESSDSEKIAALAAVLDISFDEAKIIFEKKRAQKTA